MRTEETGNFGISGRSWAVEGKDPVGEKCFWGQGVLGPGPKGRFRCESDFYSDLFDSFPIINVFIIAFYSINLLIQVITSGQKVG